MHAFGSDCGQEMNLEVIMHKKWLSEWLCARNECGSDYAREINLVVIMDKK